MSRNKLYHKYQVEWGQLFKAEQSSVLSGKKPSMAFQNGLQLSELPDDNQLTELENNLIAQMINFQYI